MIRRPSWRLGLVALVVAAVLAGAAATRWVGAPMPQALPGGQPVELEVQPGQSPHQIAQAAVRAGLEVSPWLLYQWFRWSGQDRLIRAGSYEIEPGTSPRELLRKLVDGDQTLARVRLIEGWTLRQFRAELARAPALKADSAAMSDAQLMAAIGAPEGTAAEGRFFPDTYAYARGSSDLAVLRRAWQAMERRLQAVWARRPEASPLRDPAELLTLASIVEKETGRSEDRPHVAAVFVNRLRLGMPLQTDPTVIYGLGPAFDGNLRKRDLQTDTPYNTYTRRGLPPTPIAMPGQQSLEAVIEPAGTKALYFVARGDGSSQFSETLDDHNRAVARYQRGGASR
ncbi:MAG: endolytic transglycosylase MltG [Pseudomonadota bacterium]